MLYSKPSPAQVDEVGRIIAPRECFVWIDKTVITPLPDHLNDFCRFLLGIECQAVSIESSDLNFRRLIAKAAAALITNDFH